MPGVRSTDSRPIHAESGAVRIEETVRRRCRSQPGCRSSHATLRRRSGSHPSFAASAHIASSLIAYSLLNIAALQALFVAIQDHYLRNHRTDNALMRSLPSLQAMESLMFQLIAAGLLFLTLSLMSGFLFLDDMFAQHLAHKTVLSLLAWLVFAILLVGRQRFGWRGQTAIRWTLGGFMALMLAYFGSKMVLELILKRT